MNTKVAPPSSPYPNTEDRSCTCTCTCTCCQRGDSHSGSGTSTGTGTGTGTGISMRIVTLLSALISNAATTSTSLTVRAWHGNMTLRMPLHLLIPLLQTSPFSHQPTSIQSTGIQPINLNKPPSISIGSLLTHTHHSLHLLTLLTLRITILSLLTHPLSELLNPNPNVNPNVYLPLTSLLLL
ncbi:hypothetical protein EX30DRAFT_114190 [Ascodesmis nigricans]|uniref:Uncharacterized protein n=1 Tax=Ascodesmis nigricans TaxID=341454 RepID=A0A4S2MPW1_9PEZI|nr:hypothetical protein EX30DRAFT_114190 [Ascodesmis nigricans]